MMPDTALDKIKNGLSRLSYLINQTTRPELAVNIVNVLQLYHHDKQAFLQQGLETLEMICQFKSILPKRTYLLAVATLEQVKHELQ